MREFYLFKVGDECFSDIFFKEARQVAVAEIRQLIDLVHVQRNVFRLSDLRDKFVQPIRIEIVLLKPVQKNRLQNIQPKQLYDGRDLAFLPRIEGQECLHLLFDVVIHALVQIEVDGAAPFEQLPVKLIVDAVAEVFKDWFFYRKCEFGIFLILRDNAMLVFRVQNGNVPLRDMLWPFYGIMDGRTVQQNETFPVVVAVNDGVSLRPVLQIGTRFFEKRTAVSIKSFHKYRSFEKN